MKKILRTFAFLLNALLLVPAPALAEDKDEKLFLHWASQSLQPLLSPNPDQDRGESAALRRMIGSARVVALSEAAHAGAEPLAFRNHLLKYLVEQLGFTAIAIESGLTEGQGVYDYVLGGPGDLQSTVKQGISWTMDRFPQNEELVRWLREYNGDPKHPHKVHFYGFDVPGSPGNSEAVRGPSTALLAVLDYLESVDSKAAAEFRARADPLVPFMRLEPSTASKSEAVYTQLPVADRDKLTALVADLVSLVERRAEVYTAATSDLRYQWAYRNALCARQIDAWLRQIPFNSKWPPTTATHLPAWLWEAHETRDRAMADNLKWILDREGTAGKILVFASRFHLTMTPVVNTAFDVSGRYHSVGSYLKRELGNQLVTIGHFAAGGSVGCGNLRMEVQAPTKSFDGLLSRLSVPSFLLDLRQAPDSVTPWLERTHDPYLIGMNVIGPIVPAFDIIFFTQTSTPACPK
jgi:erythromycin esterase